jgi:hypothetical protein
MLQRATQRWSQITERLLNIMDSMTRAVETLSFLNMMPRIRDTLCLMNATPHSDCPNLWTTINETVGTKLDDRAPGNLEATRPPRCPVCGCRRMRRGQTQEGVPLFICNAYPTCKTLRRAPPIGETTSTDSTKCQHLDETQKPTVARYGNATGSYKKCTRCQMKWKFDVTTNRWEDFEVRERSTRAHRSSDSSASSSTRSPASLAPAHSPSSPAPPSTDGAHPQRAHYPNGQPRSMNPAEPVHLPDRDAFEEMQVDGDFLALEWESPVG